ncbi:MFS transporter [Lentzea sp. NBRC 105346]|uniref:MFS transporter n=1 Tax=Lentzea sp. NBRC 105346 TaxID=3032205 RepID=UPI0025534C9F|nr:MFS transporter [Lentzea sp. NBRC 105346]
MSTVENRSRERVSNAPEANPRRWQALAVLALVQFMIVIDNTIVNIALPSIRNDLGTSQAGLAWVVNGYLLTAGGLLLLGGRVADLLGRKKIFVVGTAIFAIASLTSGSAWNSEVLIVSRFLQGVGEALASPAALALIVLMFTTPKERAKALGIWGGLAGIGATVGVLLSGVIVDLANWRWVFFINLPVAAIALALCAKLVHDAPAEGGKRKLDVPGGLLVTGGLILVVNGLLRAAEHPWGSFGVWGSFIAGFVLLGLFAVVESRTADPMMPLRFFANRTRVSANVTTILLTSAMAAMFFIVTLYVQQVLGYSPLQSGLAYIPFCIAFMPGMIVSTQLVTRFGPKTAIIVGFVVSAAGMLLLARIDAQGSFWGQLVPATVVLAFGLAIGLPALQNAALHELSGADAGLGSGVQTSVQQLGSALGLAVLTTIALNHATASGLPQNEAIVSGYRFAFVIAAIVLAVGAGLVAAFMQKVKAPETPAVPV